MAVTRESFRVNAKPLSVVINGVPMVCDVKEFSTGGLGWYTGGKITVQFNGDQVKCQVGLNISVVGSKDLPK